MSNLTSNIVEVINTKAYLALITCRPHQQLYYVSNMTSVLVILKRREQRRVDSQFSPFCQAPLSFDHVDVQKLCHAYLPLYHVLQCMGKLQSLPHNMLCLLLDYLCPFKLDFKSYMVYENSGCVHPILCIEVISIKTSERFVTFQAQ